MSAERPREAGAPRVSSPRVRLAAVGGLLLLLAAPLGVGAEDTPGGFDCTIAVLEPDDELLEACPAIIAEVVVDNGNIFDTGLPAEDRRIFHAANALHVRTNQDVIRRMLLFEEGDHYSRQTADESERILRHADYFHDAQIRPVRYRNGLVDVVVITRDVWTLTPGFSFARSGGENRSHFSVEEHNFLGLGKSVILTRASNVDRSTSSVRYRDPAVAGTRARAEAWYAQHSDGRALELSLERPFYALDARWAVGASANDWEKEVPLYANGHVRTRLDQQSRSLEAYAGLSSGLDEGSALRWMLGYTYDRNLFSIAEYWGRGEPPPDRLLSYPWLGFELASDNYMKARDLDRIARVEDVSLGPNLSARLGYSSRLLGADADRLVMQASAERGWRPGERTLVLVDAAGQGRLRGGETENLRLSASARFYLRDFGDQVFFARLALSAASHPDPETQILLGGDSGLRGYPLRYRDGDRSVLLTVEQRIFTPWYLFQLIRVGAAAFADAGGAWYAAGDGRQRILRDVGVGLRFANTRSSSIPIIHVDLAYPLDGEGGIDRLQWLVSTHETF